jgi:hypothetical protein
MSAGEDELLERCGRYASDPLEFAYWAYPWGTEEVQEPGPRRWQSGILRLIKEHLRGPDRYTALRIAVSSGHGIGKSALIAMVCGWAMSCYEDARINITANTGKQLETKTWPEMSVWFRRLITSHWFRVKSEFITSIEPSHEKTWRIDAVPWSENNPAAFAGLHNTRKIVVLIMDEASEVAKVVWETSEGALTDADTIIIFLVFGNPTQNGGSFADCFGRFRNRWKTFQIDSRTVEGTNKTQLNEWVEDYGEDSDFVRVRVRGVFPRAGDSQFISSNSVIQAKARKIEGCERYPVILSCDVARFGQDRTVIGMRQGPKFRILKTLRGYDAIEVSSYVMEEVRNRNARMLVIDGDGNGGPVFDIVKHAMKRYWEKPEHYIAEFHGGNTPRDEAMYFNRRAEVWGMAREWMKSGDIEDDPELETDLTGPRYGFSSKNAIQLEKKDDMKKRGLASPDKGDTLAMSFAFQAPDKTHQEKLAEELDAAKDPMQNYLIQLREHQRAYRQAKGSGQWWD